MPLMDIDEVRRAAMHSAAERARLRRQQEEEEREKEKERARRKAAELESKMKVEKVEKEEEKDKAHTEAQVGHISGYSPQSYNFISFYSSRSSKSSRMRCSLRQNLQVAQLWSQFRKSPLPPKCCPQSRRLLDVHLRQEVHFALLKVAVHRSPHHPQTTQPRQLRMLLRGGVKRYHHVRSYSNPRK